MLNQDEIATPKGIPNIGNSCFMNGVLQCLIWTPMLRQQLESMMSKKHKESKNITYSLLQLIIKAHQVDDDTYCSSFLSYICSLIYPKNRVSKKKALQLLKAARQKNSQFDGYDKQDSFEMFNTIISGIEEENEETGNSQLQSDAVSIIPWCPVSKLFGGVFLTIYLYSSCDHVDPVNQRFTSISIPVIEQHVPFPSKQCCKLGGKATTYYQCIETLKKKTEIMSGVENGLQSLTLIEPYSSKDLPCRLCNETYDDGVCYKALMILIPPPILVLQINRFRENPLLGRLQKIQAMVSYPETLDISPFVSKAVKKFQPDLDEVQYSLYGVVCHHGNIEGGHYYAFIKTRHMSLHFERFLIEGFSNYDDPEGVAEFLLKAKSTNPETEIVEIEGGRNDGMENNKNDLNKRHETAQNKIDEQNHYGFEDTEYQWYEVSDLNVKPAENPLGDPGAYILMYERST